MVVIVQRQPPGCGASSMGGHSAEAAAGVRCALDGWSWCRGRRGAVRARWVVMVQSSRRGAVRALHFVNAGGGSAPGFELHARVSGPPLTPALQLALTAPRRLPWRGPA